MPLDTPAVTPDPHTSSTEDERSPTAVLERQQADEQRRLAAPVAIAPGTPTHPPTEVMEVIDVDADEEKEP
eukprot:2100025-Heterocapsa_arctica.AAC.1